MGFLGLRNQSGSCGSRTIGSMLTGGGAGGVRRMYAWYTKNNYFVQFYDAILDIKYGKFKITLNGFYQRVF